MSYDNKTAAYFGARDLPDVIDYVGEFGAELVTFLPFVYWLYRAGQLGNRKISTYRGMRSFYFFLADDQLVEKDEPRKFVNFKSRIGLTRWDFLPNPNEHIAVRSPYEAFPNYRKQFKSARFMFDKPLLVVHNKFNREWNSEVPINFFSINELEQIFSRLKAHYQIVYVRHGRSGTVDGYSPDHNVMVEFDETRVMQRHPEVIDLEHHYREHGSGVAINQYKNELYAACYHFISVQGGGSYQCAVYSGSLLLILHRRGPETVHSYANGFYQYATNPAPICMVAFNERQLQDGLGAFEDSSLCQGRVMLGPNGSRIANELAPSRIHRKGQPVFGTDRPPLPGEIGSQF